jgi:internalin A
VLFRSELLDGIKLDNLPGWANEAPNATSQVAVAAPFREIRIFLASSSELCEDRDEFDRYFLRQNSQLRKKGFYLEIIRWEDFLDAMSETRLQDEYNKAIRECDIFVGLFFTKTGKFTEEEFNVAHRQFKSSGRPLIYTFFRNADIKTGSARKEDLVSLWAFQEKLDKLGHFYTRYDNIEHLKLRFGDQLDKILEQYVTNGKF